MKILDHTVPSTCLFCDLAPGEVVKSRDGFLFMKTNPFFSDPEEDAEEFNAISLTSGENAYFGYGEEVYRVEATLTVTSFVPSSR